MADVAKGAALVKYARGTTAHDRSTRDQSRLDYALTRRQCARARLAVRFVDEVEMQESAIRAVGWRVPAAIAFRPRTMMGRD